MAQVGDTWYRYDDVVYSSGVDECGDPVGPGRLVVELTELKVTRVTPKGVKVGWSVGDAQGRFIANRWTKRFACPTKEEAQQSFVARKSRQAGILEARARRARKAIELVLDQPPTDEV